MSEIKVNKISPRTNCGTVQLGDSGDTITIPAGATITNNGTQTGFGRTGTVDWDTTAKTASFTAVSGEGYFCNTTSGAFTATLPAGSAGAIVSFADYAATWQTNNLTVSPDGTDKIGGVNLDVTLNTEGQSVTFVYIDSTQGWINTMDSTSNVRGNAFIIATGGTITTCGNCKIHTFTGPGTFCVSEIAACSANNLVSYMVVAGGGGGGAERGGGGGAGGFRELKSPSTPYTASPLDGYPTPGNRITVTATGFPITVGGGGPSGSYPPYSNGVQGSNSVFSTITSTGGGAGGGARVNPANTPIRNGGSGGGGAHNDLDNPGKNGGTGNNPPVTPAQGTNGGNAGSPPAPQGGAAGGGGGATQAGSTGGADGSTGGAGGAGAGTGINPSTCVGTPGPSAPLRYFAGGAGGGAWSSPAPGCSPGGVGGGGTGGGPPNNSTAGTTNTGGGGGGGSPGYAGKAGGSGIVIIRYKYQ
jgi:hypothetical protein